MIATTQRFNPFSNSDQEPRINWTPGMPRRYSPDRKEGCIKRRSAGELYNEGRSIDLIVLLPLPIFSACMYDQTNPDGSPKYDTWSSLGFLDARNSPSVIMLSDGTTEALRPWMEFQQDLEADNIPIGSVITTMSFKPFKSGRGHSYVFSFRYPKSKEEKDRMALIEAWYQAENPIVYEPNIPVQVLTGLLKRMGYDESDIMASSPQLMRHFNDLASSIADIAPAGTGEAGETYMIGAAENNGAIADVDPEPVDAASIPF